MDERRAQFFVGVGRMCADAAIARLRVSLRLASGLEIAGVPDPPAPTEGAGQLDETGLADQIAVAGTVVALSDVVEAVLIHPANDGHDALRR
jgi:hypothetical protein